MPPRYGDAAAQEIAQNKMVDAVAAGLSRQFAVDHMERSGTVLQIYLNPRLAVGSKARFNLKSIRTKSNALSLAYGLDLRNLPPAARCRKN